MLVIICLAGAAAIYAWAYWASDFNPNLFKCTFAPYDPDNWTWRVSDCAFMNDMWLWQ